MRNKILVIFGIAAVTGYLFRDRIAAGALALMEKVNGLSKDDVTEEAHEYEGLYTAKEN